jgi:hypothetical protein
VIVSVTSSGPIILACQPSQPPGAGEAEQHAEHGVECNEGRQRDDLAHHHRGEVQAERGADDPLPAIARKARCGQRAPAETDERHGHQRTDEPRQRDTQPDRQQRAGQGDRDRTGNFDQGGSTPRAGD